MTLTLAVAGKGGTGKTTFTALLIRYLEENGRTPILAIDADPSANLNLVLGMELTDTIGDIREEALEQVSTGTFRSGISKPEYFDLKVNECLVESSNVDLLAMGRPEGPGCYCAANSILRVCIDRLGNDYACVVIDNEAGMEHISRQTTRDIDILFIVSDPTVRGLTAGKHIAELINELGSRIRKTYLVLNRVDGALPETLLHRTRQLGVELIGTLPEDSQIAEFDMIGRPLVEIDSDSLVYRSVADIAHKALGSI